MNRIVSFDILKGMSMYLVIFGHCLQYITYQTFENTLFQIVYVFHMPLFMIISGYLFHKKINEPLKKIVFNQFMHLIVPSVILGGIIHLISVGYINITDIIKLPLQLWFLSTLFICSVSYAVMYRVSKRIEIIIIVLSLAALCIPIGAYYIKFFMPFFGIGILLSTYNYHSRINLGNKVLIILLVGIVVLYALLWNPSYYVYITPPPYILSGDSEKWIAYFMRLVFGTLITIYLMALFKKQKGNSMVTKMLIRFSYNSLYLYIIHFILLISISDRIRLDINSELLSDLIMLIVATILTVILNLIIDLLRKNKYTKALILADFKE